MEQSVCFIDWYVQCSSAMYRERHKIGQFVCANVSSKTRSFKLMQLPQRQRTSAVIPPLPTLPPHVPAPMKFQFDNTKYNSGFEQRHITTHRAVGVSSVG